MSATTALAQYDAPASYYNGATGTGATLKTQLRTIMTSGFTGQNYGNARYSAPVTDADPNAAGKILLIYNRASVSSTWDAGGTWNREHIWPESRLGASSSNGSTNIASDQFNLRPANPGINSSRGNNPFGPDNASGSYGNQGGMWYPGAADAGDVARAQFYMATRWSQLSLVDSGSPSGTQMGDLSSLLRFHYKDVPDTFERRRNHAIYGLAGENSPAISNQYKQSNRNAYVDRPEYVHSVFVDQQNDTRLSVGPVDANGASTADVSLGRVLRNAPIPAAKSVTLSKAGVDGTYFSATTTGSATSTITGRHNAFAMDAAGSRVATVGLAAGTSTASAGRKSGSVIFDNLDITTAGGAGRGANDANDTVNVSLSVLDRSNSSFGGATDTNTLTLDFGTVEVGDTVGPKAFSIFNVASSLGADLTANLDLDSIVATGDALAFSTTIGSFSNLAAGASRSYASVFDTSAPGDYSATYLLNFSDENLPGTVTTTFLTLQLTGSVVAVPEPAHWISAAASLLVMTLRRGRRAKPIRQ